MTTTSAATTGCSVTYQVTGSWQGGFQGDIAITNLGDAVSSWSLGFDFPTTTQKVTQGWGGKFSQAGAHVTVANEVLDLFNEPYPERATGDETSGWKCWRDGGTCTGIGYQVAGFQSLVTTVRATCATNVIMIGGLAYSNNMSQWLAYKPADSLSNLAAFAHIYNFNTCANTSCWDSQIGATAQTVPVTLTEIGENDCAHGFVDSLMNWADAHNIGYLGWTWNTWDCSSGPSLISNYDGTATAYGQGLKARLATVSN